MAPVLPDHREPGKAPEHPTKKIEDSPEEWEASCQPKAKKGPSLPPLLEEKPCGAERSDAGCRVNSRVPKGGFIPEMEAPRAARGCHGTTELLLEPEPAGELAHPHPARQDGQAACSTISLFTLLQRRRRWEQLSSEGSLAQHGQAHPRCPPPSPLVILQEMLQQDFGDKRYTALLDLLKKKPLEIKELGAKKALPKWRRRLSRRSPRLRTQALSFDLGFLWLPKGRGRGTDPALGDELFLLWETSLWCLLAWPTSPTSRGSTWGSCWRKESSQGSLESKTPTLEVKLD